jgi:hypothetical protein
MATKKPALKGLQSALFDPQGMGTNMATLDRARSEEDQYYRNALAEDPGGVGGAATVQSRTGTQMQDPGMKAFLQALHEKQAAITPRSGFVGSGNYPLESEYRSTYDPTFQTSAVDPAAALARLSQKRKK